MNTVKVIFCDVIECPIKYVTLYSSRVVLKYSLSPINHLFMKSPHPFMKYLQLLTSGVIAVING